MTNEEFVEKFSGIAISEEDLAHLANQKCVESIGALAKRYLDAGHDFISELDKHGFELG